MKKIISVVLVVIMAFAFASCKKDVASYKESKIESTKNDSKVLVVYFSRSGNTEKLANMISSETKADLYKIETSQNYPAKYEDLTDFAKEEKEQNARPKLKGKKVKIDNYDIIFVGYPIWWGDMPMVLYSFFDSYDFAEKDVVPFCTHGGSGLSNTVESIRKLEPRANVLEGLEVLGDDVDKAKSDVTEWINQLGIKSK